MDGGRLATWCSCLGLLCGLAAVPCRAGSDNFESTVGVELASIALTALELRDAQRNAGTGSAKSSVGVVACELCDPASRRSLAMPHEGGRLDQRLRSRYRQLGESLAARLWDDPKGRRVKFDIEGKPGLGLVIPFD